MQETRPGMTQIVSLLRLDCPFGQIVPMSDHLTIDSVYLRMPRKLMISIGDSGTVVKLRRISTHTIHAPGVHINEKDGHNNNPSAKHLV